MKKRILLVNEASILSSGFGVYGAEILKRLHSTEKYEIAELGAFVDDADPRWQTVPWKFYPNQPINPTELQIYNQSAANKFGGFRFEKACLEFKPHVIWDIRDWWMSEFEERSPFRPFFKWVLMPPVDSAPLDETWISSYANADAICTYSEFGVETLRKQGGDLINICGVASPGANLEDLPYIVDKVQHKKNSGVPEDIFVIGTVMRNQERKLYPDLIQAFTMFLEQAPPEIAKRSYLYLHTMYPDVGWRIPLLLKEAGIFNKTLFTYTCPNCKAVFPCFYHDARAFCRQCGAYNSMLPSVQIGVERNVLGKIYNIFDVYVQYATCEGFGMPLVEAAACGTPILAVDYSAMSDILKKLDGIPIKVQRMFRDIKTHAWRALPDNQDFVDKMIKLAILSKEERTNIGSSLRKDVEEYYTWDKAAKVWENCFDNLEVLLEDKSWGAPNRISQPNVNIPQFFSNEDFVEWAIVNIAGRPELLNTFVALRLVRDLNWGITQSLPGNAIASDNSFIEHQPTWTSFSRNDVVNEMVRICEHKNYWENQRRMINA